MVSILRFLATAFTARGKGIPRIFVNIGKGREAKPGCWVRSADRKQAYIKGLIINQSVFGPNEKYHGEFDPGSERTLAARLKHASRAARYSNVP